MIIWLRNGWNIDPNSVIIDSKSLGADSPVITVYIPKKTPDQLRQNLIDYKAADKTLEERSEPDTQQGKEARASIKTIKQQAEKNIGSLLKDIFSDAIVYQSGGDLINGNSLKDCLNKALQTSLIRLYPEFDIADDEKWAKVYEQASNGDPQALKAVGYSGDDDKNPVCRKIIDFISSKVKGKEIFKYFSDPPYGWSSDAVAGALQVLLIADILNAQDDRGKTVIPSNIRRRDLNNYIISIVSTVINTSQKLKIRRIYKKLNITAQNNEELKMSDKFIHELETLADGAGGNPPKPEIPDKTIIEKLKNESGNNRLLEIYNNFDNLESMIDNFTHIRDKINQNMPKWERLDNLISHAGTDPDFSRIIQEAESIKKGRMLLKSANQIETLLRESEQLFRKKLNDLVDKYDKSYHHEMDQLNNNACWQQLDDKTKNELLKSHNIDKDIRDSIKANTCEQIQNTLERDPLHTIENRIKALPGKFSELMISAVRMLSPASQPYEIPRKTLNNENDIENWLSDISSELKEKIKNGPIILK